MDAPTTKIRPQPSRARRRLLVGLCALALAVLVGCTPEQQAAMDAVNETRAEHGAPALLPSFHAMDKAQAWAEHLAEIGKLEHSQLTDGMPEGWYRLGENVGRGPSIAAIHKKLMTSPGHRANIVDRDFGWVGTGHAVADDGRVYLVQVFAKY